MVRIQLLIFGRTHRSELGLRRTAQGMDGSGLVAVWSRKGLLLVGVLAFCLLGLSVSAQASVFWTQPGANEIGMAASDGSGANSAFITGASEPIGVAADANYVYWVNSRTGTIGRAPLSGDSPDQTFIPNAAPANTSLDGIAVGGGYIFWTDTDNGVIGRASLNGSNVQPNFITGANGPAGIATNGQEIYWANDGNDTIGEAAVDGSGVNQSFIGYTAAGQVNGIAVTSQYIFWTNDANSSQSIGRANLDGSGAVEDFITGSSVTTPSGIAADSNYVYWSNYASPGIARADTDGTDINPDFITTAAPAFGVTLAGPPPLVPPVVNSTGDAPASSATSGSCDTGSKVLDATGASQPECTLRAAIQAVNALGKGQITFDIPGSALGPIKPASALPALTASGALIDGTTETGGLVTIDGGKLGKSGDCVNVAASGVTVKGLDLANCPTGIELQPPGDDKVQGDLIGFGADGVTAAHGVNGVVVDAGSTGNTIGGVTAAQRDVIGNQSFGVSLEGSDNLVQGDFIGTDESGAGFAPNQLAVTVSAGASGDTIGGSTASAGTGAGNVIVGGSLTSTFAFSVMVLGTSNTVAGNLIGTDADRHRGVRAYQRARRDSRGGRRRARPRGCCRWRSRVGQRDRRRDQLAGDARRHGCGQDRGARKQDRCRGHRGRAANA